MRTWIVPSFSSHHLQLPPKRVPRSRRPNSVRPIPERPRRWSARRAGRRFRSSAPAPAQPALQGRGRIQGGAAAVVQRLIIERCWIRPGTVSAQELRAIAGVGRGSRTRRGERYGARVVFAPALAGQHRAGWPIKSSLYVQLLAFPGRAQSPLREIGYAELPAPRRLVAQPQAANLYRITFAVFGNRDKHQQFLLNRMAIVFENRVALTMPRTIRILLTNGRCGGCPTHSGLVIPDVNDLGRRVTHGIIRPWGETIPLTISVPGESQAALAHDSSEARIRHDVDPGRRRECARRQIDGILASVAGEASQSIEVRKFQER